MIDFGRAKKKPVEIEYFVYDGTVGTANHILAWIGGFGQQARRVHPSKPEEGLIIKTLEGDMQVSLGDVVIKGVQNEFYPCKPEIFEATYDRTHA